jgi:putative tryptophan/tyrosine transport system substrate-binding protein
MKEAGVSSILIAVVLLAFGVTAEAQQPEKVYRIGYLSPRVGIESQDEAFREALRELGYVEGQKIRIEWRFAKGKTALFPDFAAELVRLKVDCIVALGVGATRAAKDATKSIPIVMGNASDDPVRRGLIASLASPGGNITGFTDMAPDLAGKRLEILKEAFPKVSRVGHLWERGSSPGATHFKEVEAAGRALRVRVQALEVPGPNDLLGAFQSARVAGADSLIVVGFGFLNSHRERIVNLATKHRLPAMYTTTPYVVVGGLMSYAPDGSDRMRRAAVYVDKILKGTKPTDLPVQQPMKFEFVVNLKTVTQIGLTISPNVLARADRVIK